MLCGEALLVKRTIEEIGARLLRCRSWGCELCREGRGRQLKALARAGEPNRFLTLTVNPAFYPDAETRARKLVAAWRKVRLRAMRKYKLKALPFLAVIEATKRGEPHLHIIARFKWIDHDWLSEQMRLEIGAPVVGVEAVKDQARVGWYIAKYVGKAPHKFSTLKRYWHSRDWRVVPRAPRLLPVGGQVFDLVTSMSLDRWLGRIRKKGLSCCPLDGWWVCGHPPPGPPYSGGWLVQDPEL